MRKVVIVTTTDLRVSPLPAAPGRSVRGRLGGLGATVPRPVVMLALLAALLRLPYAGAPMSPDEGGFLVVGGQWTPGPSLYGHYWVDRPPLLIEIFRVADHLGGLFALRLIGCLAVAATVVAVGMTLRGLGGSRAATWGAAVTAALLVSPMGGAIAVNGELLAAPLVALGAWSAVEALRARPAGTALAWAVSAGATTAGAVLVKQNMLDPAVFAVVIGLAAWRVRQVSLPRLGRLGAAYAAGAALTSLLVLGAAALRGSSPRGVLYAMYPFRWDALAAVQQASLPERVSRLVQLFGRELVMMAPVVLVGLVLVAVHRRRERSLELAGVVATLAMAAYAVLSVSAGGSYWSHYLVELAVPTALAGGLLVEAAFTRGRFVVALLIVSSAIAWTGGLMRWVDTGGSDAGAAIAEVAQPGDTIVSLFGEPEVVRTAGLQSPYPYLWSLPTRTLDPSFRHLAKLLSGSNAPTWFVTRSTGTVATLQQHNVGTALDLHYRRLGEVCGRGIYLHDGAPRPTPNPGSDCTRPLSSWIGQDIAPDGGTR